MTEPRRDAVVSIEPGLLRIETSDGQRVTAPLPSHDAKTWWTAHQKAWHRVKDARGIAEIYISDTWDLRVEVNNARQPTGPAIPSGDVTGLSGDVWHTPGTYLMLRLCGRVDRHEPLPALTAAAAGAGLSAGIPVSIRVTASDS